MNSLPSNISLPPPLSDPVPQQPDQPMSPRPLSPQFGRFGEFGELESLQPLSPLLKESVPSQSLSQQPFFPQLGEPQHCAPDSFPPHSLPPSPPPARTKRSKVPRHQIIGGSRYCGSMMREGARRHTQCGDILCASLDDERRLVFFCQNSSHNDDRGVARSVLMQRPAIVGRERCQEIMERGRRKGQTCDRPLSRDGKCPNSTHNN